MLKKLWAEYVWLAPATSSRQHPVSALSWCKNDFSGQPKLAYPYAGVYKKKSLVSSPLLLLQYFSCCVHHICMIFEMGSRWPYSCYFVEFYFQDLFKIAWSILLEFTSRLFSLLFVNVHVVVGHSYTLEKKSSFLIGYIWYTYDR